MKDLGEILEVEKLYVPPSGKPSLGEAFQMLLERWDAGARDRETGLRLLFLAWYSCAEPNWATGLPIEGGEGTFQAVFQGLGGEQSDDAEFLFAISLMAGENSFSWCCGDSATWLAIAKRCRARAIALRPQGFSAADFEGRGEYGRYFAHMVTVSRAAV